MSPEAAAQTEDIKTYIGQEAGTDIAERFVGKLIERCDRIGALPFGGTPRDELSPGIRSVPFRKAATVFYSVTDEHVLIVGILYRGRDPATHFTPTP